MHPETVKIVSEVSKDNPLGYIVINKEDFVEGEHKLFVESDDAPAKAAKGKKAAD